MSDTIKLIIEIPKETKQIFDKTDSNNLGIIGRAIQNGIPLDSNDSDYAEAQAYFAGMSYGWEEGRKALIDDVKAEIEHMACRQYEHRLTLDREEVIEILDNIGKAESEE